VPHPILLGLLTAVAAMIPFGAAVMFGIASLMLIGQGAVGWAVAVFAIGIAYQVSVSNAKKALG